MYIIRQLIILAETMRTVNILRKNYFVGTIENGKFRGKQTHIPSGATKEGIFYNTTVLKEGVKIDKNGNIISGNFDMYGILIKK